MQKENPSFVRPFRNSLLDASDGYIGFRNLVEGVPVIGRERATIVTIWRFLGRLPFARAETKRGSVRWTMQEAMKCFVTKWELQVATVGRSPDLVKKLFFKDGWKTLEKILGIDEVGKQEEASKTRRTEGKSDAGSATSRMDLEEVHANIKKTLDELRQLRPSACPYQAFVYFMKCITRVVGEELCRNDDDNEEEKTPKERHILMRAEKANFLAKTLNGRDRPKVTAKGIRKMSVAEATLVEVNVDVIPTLSQKDIDDAAREREAEREAAGKGKKGGKGKGKKSGKQDRQDPDYERVDKIPLFASFVWTQKDMEYYWPRGSRDWPKPIKGLDAGREFGMSIKSDANGNTLDFAGIITSCHLAGKKNEERADKGSRFRRLEAPLGFSFVTENIKEVRRFVEEDVWTITEIRISGVLVDARALAKIEQIPLPRLAARVGIGAGELTEEDLPKMGEKERSIFSEKLEPPRALDLCEKMLAWTEEA